MTEPLLVDTSAWIEYLRDTGSDAARRVDAMLDGPLITCDAVAMEVLAGGRDARHVDQLRALLARYRRVPVVPGDFDTAALIYRSGRARGITVRKLTDCLIAAVALREDLTVLHADQDFDAIAAVVPLRTVPRPEQHR